MVICLRPAGRILLGHRFRFSNRKCQALFSFRGFNARSISSGPSVNNPSSHPYTVRPPRSRAKHLRCPVPRSERTDIAKWIPFLDRFLPSHLREGSVDCLEDGVRSEAEQCQAILQLLFQARSFMNFDLLAYMGFKMNRWNAVRALVDKLLDNAEALRSKHAGRNDLPSNIDWKSMGRSFDEITGDELYRTLAISVQGSTDFRSLDSYDSYSEEPILGTRMGETNLRVGTMEELWQSLGYFIIEAADMRQEESALIMHHFYYIVARLHNLDYIPSNVYKDTPIRGSYPLLRPPAMHLLSTRIMTILTDTMLEARMEELSTSTDQQSSMEWLRSSKTELGFGVWLEFILWCCVEGGYAREAAWILQSTRNRSKEWKVASFARLLKTIGPIDPKKIDHHDTWEQCGNSSRISTMGRPKGSFLGMGERTITHEVVVAVMDGLTNAVRTGVGFRGDSAPHVWERLGLLRGLLNKNMLYVGAGFVNYLIMRILEAGGIVAEVKPQALELLLDVSPSITTADELEMPLEKLAELSNKGVIPNKSAMILGLYHYTLNAYASSGHISGTIDVLEKLVAAVDYTRIHMIRQSIMESRYVTKAYNVRKSSLKTPLNNGSNDHEMSPLGRLQLPPSSLSLLLSVFTNSRAFSLASWVVNPRESAGPIIPSDMYRDEVLAPTLIQFATATNNSHLLSNVLERVARPWPVSILHHMLDYRIANFRWKHALELLVQLRDVERIQWVPNNVATLAATIIKLDQPDNLLPQFSSSEDQRQALEQATHILTYMLEGKFSAREDFSKERDFHPAQMLYQLHRIFKSAGSPALLDVCTKVKLKWQRPVESSCYVPANAFRTLIAAVVEVYGSAAGRQLYTKWCMYPATPRARRIDSGGNTRLFYSSQLNPETGGVVPIFDSRWHAGNAGKLVMPNLDIVRTIALCALKDQTDLTTKSKEASPEVTDESVTSVLNWCMRVFFDLGLTDREVDRELDGYLTRIRDRLRREQASEE
ncbi:hypothetical protein CPC735_006940 [Coccidioides posadasii C735 delta SOWgp]|uniref:Uncharacterized protein n=3 Tax=Coccidioides posadasii TaxID=199306 RepID=E9CZA5_COCPS|nr:hypothetical protein CPC735_006940 [Coccidioides posadasii C735 delta SOWgp]EER26522.1 hypothetical protein CPC735_006940 [Coccidioides posadasii C735 delta SOWgp]EFW20549.1 conserved hypothetical protein [Coccidioides posadasii str. Silveira]|eukprot:XP_003068667.1 hypothetical protein CPC735_006940 [Coccidioides posadasii C735 delta SOWgp]